MAMEQGVEYGITDFIEDQAAYDNLTDEQVQILSEGGTVKYGETAAAAEAETTESSETPAAATEEKPVEAVADPETVILTKDGKHTIPFAELEDARAREAQWKEIAQAQTALAESLKVAKVEDAKTGDTAAQDEVMAKFIDEYPELSKALTPAIQKMIDAGVNAKVTELEKKFAETIAPMQKVAVENSVEAHFKAITDAVPDFQEIVESKAIQAWVEKLPSYVRIAAKAVLENGTADQVIELFSDYKASLPAVKAAEPVLSKEELAAKAAAVVAKAKGKTPTSMTDVPSGTNVEVDPDAAEANMSTSQLLDKMMSLGSPEKILAKLSKVA